jgi:surface antigen
MKDVPKIGNAKEWVKSKHFKHITSIDKVKPNMIVAIPNFGEHGHVGVVLSVSKDGTINYSSVTINGQPPNIGHTRFDIPNNPIYILSK